jgi:hypothetical protein
MANITITALTVDGVKLPAPAADGVTISNEKLWSQDTGRSASGKLNGTIVAQKVTLAVKWPPLTPQEAKIINDKATSGEAFHSVKYTDISGETYTKEMYFGSPSGTWGSWAEGAQYVTDYSVDMIER